MNHRLTRLQVLVRLVNSLLQFNSIKVSPCDLSGKSILVTGGARGIGAAISTRLAMQNAHVLVACRQEQQGSALRNAILLAKPGARVSVLPAADTSDLSAMPILSQRVKALLGDTPLDGLVLNAGIAGVKCRQSPQQHEMHVATNVLGHHALAVSLLEQMRGSADARIIYVTGDIYIIASNCTLDYSYPDNAGSYAYARSKLGVTWNAISMHEYLEKHEPGIKSIALHPGVVASELVKGGEWFKNLFLISPQRSAESILHTLASPSVHSGDYIHNVKGKMQLPPNDPALNQPRRREFWEECNQACNNYFNSNS